MSDRTCAACRWWQVHPEAWPDGVARSGRCSMIRGDDDRWSVVAAQLVGIDGRDAADCLLVTGRRFGCVAWEAKP